MAAPTTLTSVPGERLSFAVRKFSVEEYHQLARMGVLRESDPYELLEGWIVLKMTRNPPHDTALQLLEDLLRHLLPSGWCVRGQKAISLTESEPEPDIAVARGDARTYAQRHPTPADIGFVVEVAESSLAEDRSIKLRIYARSGIPSYWIVNLVDSQVEVYMDPSGPIQEPHYRQHQDFGPDATVPLVIDGKQVAQVAVRDILP